jgi:NAD(P)-dependent dehydrogenase (short-subunit alcohol dehydrogenase family)
LEEPAPLPLPPPESDQQGSLSQTGAEKLAAAASGDPLNLPVPGTTTGSGAASGSGSASTVGGGGASSFAEFPTETYRRVLAVNLDGVFFTFREACKHMVERANGGDKAGGSLVVISSLSAYDGAPRNEAYAATKGAVISMIRSIAVEHARYGVRANAVLPGWIATDMTAGAQGNDKFNDAVIRRVPARRWGQPADFGGIAVYLSSDASAFHTGDSFLIDGGYGIF